MSRRRKGAAAPVTSIPRDLRGFYAVRDRWLRIVLSAPELPTTSALVAVAIALSVDRGGTASPSHRELAEMIGVFRNTAQQGVRRLRERGFLIVDRGGRRGPGSRNSYAFAIGRRKIRWW